MCILNTFMNDVCAFPVFHLQFMRLNKLAGKKPVWLVDFKIHLPQWLVITIQVIIVVSLSHNTRSYNEMKANHSQMTWLHGYKTNKKQDHGASSFCCFSLSQEIPLCCADCEVKTTADRWLTLKCSDCSQANQSVTLLPSTTAASEALTWVSVCALLSSQTTWQAG